MFSSAIIENPKQGKVPKTVRDAWYPYYAGYSSSFASQLIRSIPIERHSFVLDPWNGGGTTSYVSAIAGHHPIGFDINPVMILVGRARLLCAGVKNSVLPIYQDIVSKSASPVIINNDPLCAWFSKKSAAHIRSIERAINTLLVGQEHLAQSDANGISDLASFFYVALFRTTRELIQQFLSTNPTWIKRPKNPEDLVRFSKRKLGALFNNQIEIMLSAIDEAYFENQSKYKDIRLATSINLPIDDNSVDFILTSPPYCTRIDYAVSTSVELAILGYDDCRLRDLRNKMIGTSTITGLELKEIPSSWGRTCKKFLKDVEAHPSKASVTYYRKNFIQYFDGIHRSIEEMARVLKRGAGASFVIQDSFYKNIHNNVPKMLSEMAQNNNLILKRSCHFKHKRTMAGINPNVRSYRNNASATESVLCFIKE